MTCTAFLLSNIVWVIAAVTVATAAIAICVGYWVGSEVGRAQAWEAAKRDGYEWVDQ